MISVYLTYLLIDRFKILWNDLMMKIDEECDSETIAQGTNEPPFKVAKDAMTNITEFFVPPFKNLQGMALVLKSDIVEEMKAAERYIDVPEMKNELNPLVEKLECGLTNIMIMYDEVKIKVESISDPNLEWPNVIKFMRVLDNFEKEISDTKTQLKERRGIGTGLGDIFCWLYIISKGCVSQWAKFG